MATQKVLQKWLVSFSSLAKPPLASEAIKTLVMAYEVAFKGVEDKAFEYACEQYLQHGKFFPPKPFELQQLIPRDQANTVTKYNPSTGEKEGDYAIRVGSRCSQCHTEGTTCIQEPAFGGRLLCRKCYTGMTNEQFKKNMDALSKADAAKGVYVSYDSKTKTVNVTRSKPQTEDNEEDIF